jgi:putative FmdB family regulatory protein
MPIYEYACQKCHAKFEKLVRSMSDAAPPPCPKCGSAQTSRELSVFAAVNGGDKGSPAAMPGGCCPCGKQPGMCGMD